ncbi:MAG TPA: prepilin-type N-terminal cleavage/methylation domain-containing protein [Tepidisphaeraceae bacterium]|nr:prepilin-type N-terminal cleavage/methylation domain-containing protein [Tepidisphaeraceae bacterium]
MAEEHRKGVVFSALSPAFATRLIMGRLGNRNHHRGAFTLIEILIVVVILGILGALVYPQFANARSEAADKAARTQLQGLRSQIEMYKVQHGGALPDLITNWNPLTTATTYNTKTVGPYLPRAPKNGFNNLASVVDGDGTGPAASSAGFIYDYAAGAGTGRIWATTANGTSVFPQ